MLPSVSTQSPLMRGAAGVAPHAGFDVPMGKPRHAALYSGQSPVRQSDNRSHHIKPTRMDLHTGYVSLLFAKFRWSDGRKIGSRLPMARFVRLSSLRDTVENLSNGQHNPDVTRYKQTTNRVWAPHCAERRVIAASKNALSSCGTKVKRTTMHVGLAGEWCTTFANSSPDIGAPLACMSWMVRLLRTATGCSTCSSAACGESFIMLPRKTVRPTNFSSSIR